MSLVVARQKRLALYLSIIGLLVMVAAVSAVSARDPDGVWLRVGMVMLTVGVSLGLPWQALGPTAIGVWLGANLLRSLFSDASFGSANMALELPGVLGLAAFAGLARKSLRDLEHENLLIGATSEEFSGVDQETGVYEERLLKPALEAELARSQRFSREFALILVGVDALRQRFDYRDEGEWTASVVATSQLLRSTRTHVDRVYRYGGDGFALLLPESGEREVKGLIRRLRRDARRAVPHEGEPGGPLPTHFGATFYPHAATTVEDLMTRAEVALRLAEKSANRIQIDGAEAMEPPAPETLRRSEEEAVAAQLIEARLAHEADEPDATDAVAQPVEPEMEPQTASVAADFKAEETIETATALTHDAAASTVGEPASRVEPVAELVTPVEAVRETVAAEPAAAAQPYELELPEMFETPEEPAPFPPLVHATEPKLALVALAEETEDADALIAELPSTETDVIDEPEAAEGVTVEAGPPHLTLVQPMAEAAEEESADAAWERHVRAAEATLAREAEQFEAVGLVDEQPSLVAAAIGLQPVALTPVEDDAEEQPAEGSEPEGEPPLEDAVSKLLHHLDETLDLIRTMKSAS